MDRNLALEVVRVTEAAALESARLMGRGDAAAVDAAAARAMRRAFEAINADAVVVIGEGQEGEVEELHLGQRVGGGSDSVVIDVALDALEGATVCATGGANALSIILISERGKILRCPETYMEKLAVGPDGKGVVDIDRSPTENLKALAKAKGVYVADLTAVILDRPRHARLVDEVRRAGARVQLLADGDLSAAIATARPGSDIDILFGIGGAQQGVLAAGALECLGGEFQGRFKPLTNDQVGLLKAAGIDQEKLYKATDLVGDSVMFAATGVTNGHLLNGVRFHRGGAVTNSVVMRSSTRTVRWIEAHHHFDFKPDY
ncbi:MAG: class II fructose-bisphosphatase [Deltaproteobacteria bacterium]|nr:class II fructose-bisphosphatase [Deltaproteobacteria bacterium]